MQNPIQVIQLNLDLERLKRDCRRINTKVCKTWGDAEVATDRTYQATLADQLSAAPKSSRLHDYYNVFTFPYDGINELYREVCTAFNEINTYNEPYYVHAWLNYQSKGESIPWHQHWGALSGLHKTFVCSYYVNAEPSVTTYKFPNATYQMPAENNTITIYEDIGDTHMVDAWLSEDPRISISMDFVPMKYIQGSPFPLNTWMPVI
jgi:hypothetical protein